MEQTVSPYLEQPLRSMEQAQREIAAGRPSVRGDRGRDHETGIRAPADPGEPVVLPWRAGFSMYTSMRR